MVAGQSARPAVAADAFTSGFNFGVLLCVLVLAGDDVAGGPGTSGTADVAGDRQHGEDTTVIIPAIAAGEHCEVVVASVGVDHQGVEGRKAHTADTTAAGGIAARQDVVLGGSSIPVEVMHRREALGSRGRPGSGT